MQNLFHKNYPLLLQNYGVGKEYFFKIILNSYVHLRVAPIDGHPSDSADRVLKLEQV